MREYRLYIDGSFVPSSTGRKIESLNPFDGSVVATADAASADDVGKAVAAARKAFDDGPWSRMSRDERASFLKGISDKINDRFAELLELEVLDSGSTIRKAKEDIHLSARSMYYFSKLAALDLGEPVDGLNKPGFSKNLIVREPIGVVGAIIPWNFPLKMAVWKLGPALAAGNTVILKPSEITPVTAMELAKIIDELGVPPGVVNIISGYGPEAGEALVKHPGVDKVTFTGSTGIGKHVMALASDTLKKCTLECGGKSANIICDDADMSMALDGSMYAIFYHQGQCCEAGTRLFLPESIAGEFMDKLLEKTRKLTLGNPMETSTEIGPVVSKNQRDRILDYISKGIAEGAVLRAGGKIPDRDELANGYFVEPTIFTGVDNKMTIAQEEIFGPVLSVITYKNIDDAIRMANDSKYGLAAGVWSKDEEKAEHIARRLRSGTVWINEWHLISEKAPFGGYKQSGIGREFGIDGLKEYTETKHVHIDEIGDREKKQWYDVVVPRDV
jgi:acyl-CoA reductase-like NAD-dependent aldehyde dehydrogenase